MYSVPIYTNFQDTFDYRMRVYTYTYSHIYIYTHTHTYTVCIYDVHFYIYKLYIHIHDTSDYGTRIYTYTYSHIYIYTHTYTYTVCIYDVHVYIYKFLGHIGLWDEAVPRLVEALSKRRCILVASGANHTLAVTDNGSLWSWGDNRFGQLGHGTLRDMTRLCRFVI